MPELTLTDTDRWLLACSSALAGGFVRGFSGFGGPAVMSLLLTLFYSPLSVLPKLMLIDSVAQLQLLPSAYSEVDWKVCGTLSIASLVGIPIGSYLLVVTEPWVIRQCIAALVTICTLALLTGWRFKAEPGRAWQLAIGFVAGVAVGATFIALVAVVYFLATPARAVTARAGIIYWGFFTGIVMIGLHVALANITWSDAWRSFAVGVIYLLGAVAGTRVFRLSGERDFRRVVMWLLVTLSAAVLMA